jgi:4-hydroxy-tetrahydrodipicolinate synthase
MHRRQFLTLAGGAAALASGDRRKPLRGIFPIMQTPFTADDKVDNAVLAKQVHFLERCGSHGMVWPQLASEYFNLTTAERLGGVEAILSAGKGAKAAIVIGCQAPDAKQAVAYASHATRLGADALIALPPQGMNDPQGIVAYYKAIGEASPLPIFVQAVGEAMSVDFVVRLTREVHTLRYIKDEAGPVLARFGEFRQRAPELQSFTGNHGRTLYDEMVRGFAGSMPGASFADLYVAAWDSFHAGDRARAAIEFSRALLLITEAETYGVQSLKYMLHLRGVFPTYSVRKGIPAGPVGRGVPFDEGAKRAVRELMEHLKPHLRA